MSAVEGPVLSALPAAPASREAEGAAAPAGRPSGTVTSWDRAMARFRAAEAALSALAHSEDEALYDRAGERHDAALQRLLRTPAPNAAALADKLDLLIAHQAWELGAADSCLASLSADARRLCTAR